MRFRTEFYRHGHNPRDIWAIFYRENFLNYSNTARTFSGQVNAVTILNEISGMGCSLTDFLNCFFDKRAVSSSPARVSIKASLLVVVAILNAAFTSACALWPQ